MNFVEERDLDFPMKAKPLKISAFVFSVGAEEFHTHWNKLYLSSITYLLCDLGKVPSPP